MNTPSALTGVTLSGSALNITDDRHIARLDRSTWSPSGLSSWRSCPARWATEKLLPQAFDPFGDAQLGTSGHRVLELMFQLPPDRRTIDEAAAIIGQLSATADRLDIPDSPADRMRWKSAVLAKVSGLWQIENPATVKVLATEREIVSEVGGVPIRCIIDRTDEVIVDGHPVTHVCDFKTGRPTPPYKQCTPKDDKAAQLSIYALALEKVDGVLPGALSLYFTGEQHATSYAVPIQPRRLSKVTEDFASTFASMKHAATTGIYATTPSALCGWCPLATICPSAAREGKATPKVPAARSGEQLGIRLDTSVLPAAQTAPEPYTSPTTPPVEGEPMTTPFLRGEDSPWNTSRGGQLNPNSYASMGLFGSVDFAVKHLTAREYPATKTTVIALANTVTSVVGSAQQALFATTDPGAGSNTRLRATFYNAVDNGMQPPLGGTPDEWSTWATRMSNRLRVVSLIAGRLLIEPFRADPWLVFASPALPSVPLPAQVSDVFGPDAPVYQDQDNGHFNPNGYSAMAAYGFVFTAIDHLHASGQRITPEAVALFAETLLAVTDSVQSDVFGSTNLGAGANSRLRGVLSTALQAIPAPWGGDAAAWTAWASRVRLRLELATQIVGTSWSAGPQNQPWLPLASGTTTPAVSAA